MIRKYQYGGPGYFLGGVTAKDLDEGTKKVARGFNWLMGKVGDAFNTVVTAGASSDFGQTSPFAQMDRKAIAKGREQFRQKTKKAVEENAVYVSPSSHIAAWTQGSWDPKVGAQFLASDPRLQSLGIIGDMAAFKYVPKTVVKGVKTATKAVKGKKASNETAYSKEVKSPFYKYNENGEPVAFDAENVYSQIKAGKQDFINETLSPEYAEAAIRNMEEAQAMGLSYTPVFEKPGFQSLVQNGITPKFVQDPKGGWHASTSFFGGTPGKPSEVTYNVSKPSNIRTATAHESGHVSRWGMGESPAEHQYMKHKASQIFKDEGDVGVYEFGSQTGEGATNMRDLGKDIGVTQRTPYPGYEEALKKLKEAETTSTKGGIVKALRLDREHMPYIWRALQGLHYGIAPTLIGGYSLYNLLNSGTPQVDYQKFGGIIKTANARKWKHKTGGSFKGYPSKAAYEVRLEEVAGFKKGGIIKSQQGGSTLNYQQLGNALSNIISTGVSAYSQYQQAEANAKKQKALTEEELAALKKQLLKDSMEKMKQAKEQWQKDYAEGKTIENFSNIVNQHIGFLNYTQDSAEAEQNAKNKNAQIDADKNSQQGQILSNALSGIAQEGIGALSNYMGNRLQNKNASPSSTNTSLASSTNLSNTSFYKADPNNKTLGYYGTSSNAFVNGHTVDEMKKLMGIS